jgi:hypothetical protein
MSLVDRMRNAIAVLHENTSPTECMRAISVLEGITDELVSLFKEKT